MSNSRRVWGIKDDPVVEESSDETQDSKSLIARRRYRHWPDVLDALTEIQSKYKIVPMPVVQEGITSAGGSIELNACRISLACMNGEMNATRFLQQDSLRFFFPNMRRYSFLSRRDETLLTHSFLAGRCFT